MYDSDETSTCDNMAIPVKSVNEMDTSDSPYVEGGYVDLDAKGNGKPIVIRHSQQDAQQTQAEESTPVTIEQDSSESLTDDHVLQHKKLANKITATRLPLEHIQFRDVPSDVRDVVPSVVKHPSSSYCSTDDSHGQCEYLLKNTKETYKLSKSPGKKKLGSKQRRASGLNLIPNPCPYGAVRRFNNFNEVLGHVPEYVSVSGQTYRVQFVPQGPDSCSKSGANIPSKEMNLLDAGSIDRPPEMSDPSGALCPETVADAQVAYNEPVTYNEPLNLTYTCKPLDLSASNPLNLSINQQDRSQVSSTHVPTLSSYPLNLSFNRQNESQADDCTSFMPTLADDLKNQEPAMSEIGVGSPLCAMTAGDQPLLVTANQIPEKPVVEGTIPNLGSLTLSNNLPLVGKDTGISGRKNLQEMVNAGEITIEQLMLLYIAKKASPIQNGPKLCDPSLPGTSKVMEEVPSPIEKDTSNSNPLPNLCSLQLADNSGGMYLTQHEKTLQDLRSKVLNNNGNI